ncbi:hypothetical protein GW17_00009131 [Ensete ventricosum]|nr:hypothetical protein GW17_00009131 [Ensete ventricosum]
MGDSSSTGFFLPAQGDEARKEKGERGEASSPRAGRRQHPVSPRKNVATSWVTREWVGEGELPKERTQSEVAEALRCWQRPHIEIRVHRIRI